MNEIKIVLLDYGRIVAPEDGAPVIHSVYGTSSDDKESFELFGSLRHDLALGKINENDIRNLLIKKGHIIPDDYKKRWESTIENHLRPTTRMIKHIEELKTHSYDVALLSNVWPLSAEIIRKNGWYDYFDELYLSCDIGMAKPDKNIYDTVLQNLAVSANQILFVDDKEANLTYPQTLGMHTIKADSPLDAVKKITKYLDL